MAFSRTSGHSVSVQYGTADGTAKAGEDYEAPSGSVWDLAPGETVKTITDHHQEWNKKKEREESSFLNQCGRPTIAFMTTLE